MVTVSRQSTSLTLTLKSTKLQRVSARRRLNRKIKHNVWLSNLFAANPVHNSLQEAADTDYLLTVPGLHVTVDNFLDF